MRKEKAMNGPKRKCEADDEEEELNETRKRARLVFRSRPKNLEREHRSVFFGLTEWKRKCG